MGPSETKETLARGGAKLSPSETNHALTPLRGDTSSAPFGGTFPSRGRLGLVRPGPPSPCDLIRGKAWRGRRQERKTPTVAGASGRVSLRADERRHSPFIRQRRQKAMPARIRGKSQLSIAREGFLDRRSKRCFWLLLSPQTKVARAGARNSPLRQLRAGRGSFTPLRGDTSSAPFGGTFPSRGRLGGGGGRSEKRLPWLGQAAAEASAPVNAGTVLLSDNDDERLCPREYARNHN